MSEQLPDWLEGSVRAVLHDMQQPVEVPVRTRCYEDPDMGTMLEVTELGARGGLGITLLDWRGTGLTVHIADKLQEYFFPESRAAWGQARPACPGHPHPASATNLDGEAWWICPADRHRIARIGEL